MSFPNIKKHILSPSWTRPDWVLLLLVAVLATAFYYTYMPAAQWLHADTAIDRGYLARQDGRGLFYALDEEHSRLVCFDGDANILFSIENPSDEISGGLYIDDFAISDEGIFLSVSEWNEMNLAREAILLYDNRGRFVRTVTNRDYSDFATNKHRFQALEAKGDSVRFIECMADEILAGERHIPYPNAFNAVADAVYDGETLYVLDKTGIIYSISEQDNDRHVVYAKDQARETDCVPYRMCVDRKGQLFFTDIRNRTVRKVDRTAGNSVDVIQKTGSLTVQPAEDGSSYLLMDEEGLVVQNGNQTKTYRILHKDMSAIFRQGLCVTLSFLLLVLLFAGLLRLVFVLAHQKYTAAKLSSLISIAMVSVVAVLLCAMMMRSFRTIYREKIMEQIKSSAYTVSNQIAGTGLGEFRERIRFGQKGYNELIAVMERSFPSDIDFFRQVYCNIIALDEQGKGYALCYLDQSIGDYYPLDEDETAKLSEVYDKKTAIWNQSATDVSGTYLSVKVPVFGRDGEVTGAVDVGAETYIIDDILNAIILKIFMSIVIILMLVWVFSSEIMAYVSNLSMYRRNQKEEGSRAFPGHLVRVLIFSVFGAYNMVSTFLPVFLIRRTDIFPSHLRDLAGAVPITVNIFIIGIMSLFSAELIGRFGIRKILMAATVSSLSGNALIFILPSYASIALGLVLDGIGVGLITNALYVLITYIKDPVSRTWGLTIYNGACLSGINAGMMLGSLLAVSIGQRWVFLAVAASWLFLLIMGQYALLQLEKAIEVEEGAKDSPEAEKNPLSLVAFLSSKPVLSFYVLIQNPYIIFGSFVFYFLPLFCDEHGYSETICSLLIMLYSEIAVIAGDSATKWMEARFKSKAMYAACLMNVAALGIYSLFPGLEGMIAALILLGLSASFGKPVQQDYYLGLMPCRRFGEDRAIGIYNFTENIGESLGPILFGQLMSATPFAPAMAGFLAAVTGTNGLHLWLNRRDLSD